MSECVDTNIFVRLLTGDEPEQTQRSLDLFERAARGEVDLWTSEAVVAEVVCVLGSTRLYATPRGVIATRLGAVLVNRGLHLGHKESVLRALRLFGSSNLHFVDCLWIEHARRAGMGGIYSFDQALDRVPDVRRLEP